MARHAVQARSANLHLGRELVVVEALVLKFSIVSFRSSWVAVRIPGAQNIAEFLGLSHLESRRVLPHHPKAPLERDSRARQRTLVKKPPD
jgi:hypothetical protein